MVGQGPKPTSSRCSSSLGLSVSLPSASRIRSRIGWPRRRKRSARDPRSRQRGKRHLCRRRRLDRFDLDDDRLRDLLTAEGQQLLDELPGRLGRRPDLPQLRLDLGGGAGGCGYRDRSDRSSSRACVELVRDATAQASDGLHLLGPLELALKAEALERLSGALGHRVEQRQLQTPRSAGRRAGRPRRAIARRLRCGGPGRGRGCPVRAGRSPRSVTATAPASDCSHRGSARMRRRVVADEPDARRSAPASSSRRGRRARSRSRRRTPRTARVATTAPRSPSERAAVDQRDDLAASRGDQEALEQRRRARQAKATMTTAWFRSPVAPRVRATSPRV